MPEQQEQMPAPSQEQKTALREALKSKCVNEAMLEVLQEQRAEVIKRSRAKLKAFGIEVTDAEVGTPL